MRFLFLIALLIMSLHAKASCTDQLTGNVRYSDKGLDQAVISVALLIRHASVVHQFVAASPERR